MRYIKVETGTHLLGNPSSKNSWTQVRELLVQGFGPCHSHAQPVEESAAGNCRGLLGDSLAGPSSVCFTHVTVSFGYVLPAM